MSAPVKEEKISVLYVDDEVNNLQSFRAAFRRDFKVFTAPSGPEGHAILKEHPVEVIITDQRMPEMTGTDFLQSILHEFPDPIRILLTGFADIEAVIDAINHAQVYRYLTKPWNEEELKKTIFNAYRAYQLKKERDEEISYFIYKASHDLKGPLVSINGLVNLARAEITNTEALVKYFSLMEQSIGALDDTLSDLIEYKRMDQASLKFSLIDFEDMVQDVLKGVRHLDQYSSVEIRTKVKQEGQFKNDRGILRSILLNLVSNSIKYRRSDINDAFVAIKVEADEKEARIEVVDNGQGMPEVVLQNIFKMFYRGSSDTQGSGLGLYIVKTGIKKVGGTIEVDSVQMKGTTFKLVIPNNKATILRRENVLKQNLH